MNPVTYLSTGKTVKVKDLKAGDQLGNSEIISNPVFVGDYLGSKNQMRLKVRYANGKEVTRYWGQNTTLKIYNF